MSRNALMLAFHFPPFAQSSGGIRTLSFVRHLPDHGWHPIVLTAREHAYPEVDPHSLATVPSRSQVVRAPGLDIARHLAIAGRYPTWLATPDRWNTWALAAVMAGIACVRRHRPAILWVTFPIASALVAALVLHRFTKIPLVVDLRDPLVYEGWPEDPWMRDTYATIEKRVVARASAVVVTTPGARRLYLERYPQLPAARFRIIANGIDESLAISPSSGERASTAPIVLVHSGLMEIPDRDPTAFFDAIAQMRRRGDVTGNVLRVVLRATGHDERYRQQIVALDIGDIVSIEGRVPHADAIEEMRRADGLVLFQGAQCNRQIPAKAYEYLACRRPIIGLLAATGDTHDLIARQWQVPYVASMDSASAIADTLGKFINDLRRNRAFIPEESLIKEHSRAAGAGQLAKLFDEISGGAAHA